MFYIDVNESKSVKTIYLEGVVVFKKSNNKIFSILSPLVFGVQVLCFTNASELTDDAEVSLSRSLSRCIVLHKFECGTIKNSYSC